MNKHMINRLTDELDRREQKKVIDVIQEKGIRNIKEAELCDICTSSGDLYAIQLDGEIYFLCEDCIVNEVEVCPSCDEYITKENNTTCDICGQASHSKCLNVDPSNDDPMDTSRICDICEERLK